MRVPTVSHASSIRKSSVSHSSSMSESSISLSLSLFAPRSYLLFSILFRPRSSFYSLFKIRVTLSAHALEGYVTFSLEWSKFPAFNFVLCLELVAVSWCLNLIIKCRDVWWFIRVVSCLWKGIVCDVSLGKNWVCFWWGNF